MALRAAIRSVGAVLGVFAFAACTKVSAPSTSATAAGSARVEVTRPGRSALTASAGTVVAPGAFQLQDMATGMTADVALIGVQPVAGETQPDGSIVYPRAYAGGDVIERTTADGVEDSISFPSPPAVPQVDYDVTLGTGVAGLRLVENTLEFVDASGNPRLRVSRPTIVGADGQSADPALSVDGCAVDADPTVPWNRPVVPPGATACVLHVNWSAAAVLYPALLDPSWTSTSTAACWLRTVDIGDVSVHCCPS